MDDAPREDWAPVLKKPDGAPPVKDKMPEQEALLAEFSRKLLHRGDYVSVVQDLIDESAEPLPGQPGEPVYTPQKVYYQVIDVVHGRCRPHLVPSLDATTHLAISANVAVQVQHLCVRLQLQEEELAVFPDVDAEWLSVSELIPSRERAMQMQSWSATPSHLGGCVDLVRQGNLSTCVPLLDVECPTLVLQTALEARHWVGVERKVVLECYMPDAEIHEYDSRDLIRNRYYLQCCLSWATVKTIVDELHSGQKQLYYRLLLAGHTVEPNHGADAYKAIWDRGDDVEPIVLGSDEEYLLALEAPLPPPAPLPLPPVVPADPELLPPPPTRWVAKRRRAPSPPPSPPPPDDPPPLPPPHAEGPFLARVPPAQWRHTFPDGVRLRRDHYTDPRSGKTYKNWIISCQHHHGGCKKTRSVHFCRSFGKLEPIAFLMVWLSEGARPDVDSAFKHIHAAVDNDKIEEWIRTKSADFLRDTGLDLDVYDE